MKRGEVWWVNAGQPSASAPGYRRPAVIISDDHFNDSAIRTVIVAFLTTNPRRGSDPGNVTVPARAAGLARDCVINVAQIATVDRRILSPRIGRLPMPLLADLDRGLRLVLGH